MKRKSRILVWSPSRKGFSCLPKRNYQTLPLNTLTCGFKLRWFKTEEQNSGVVPQKELLVFVPAKDELPNTLTCGFKLRWFETEEQNSGVVPQKELLVFVPPKEELPNLAAKYINLWFQIKMV